MPEDSAEKNADLIVEVDDQGVMLASFNRPEQMNALSGSMRGALRDAIRQASADDAVRALVLTGTGRAFCAGAEVSASSTPAGGSSETPSRHARLDHRGSSGVMVEEFAACDVPVIAAINGPAVGAGFGIACCCDIRIMAESARIGSIFIRRGLAADYGASYWLPRIVGTARAYEVFFDGNPMPAGRALEIGLVHRVVNDEALLDETLEYAREIAAGPPLAYTYIRRLIQRAGEMPLHDFVELEWSYQTTSCAPATPRRASAPSSNAGRRRSPGSKAQATGAARLLPRPLRRARRARARGHSRSERDASRRVERAHARP